MKNTFLTSVNVFVLCISLLSCKKNDIESKEYTITLDTLDATQDIYNALALIKINHIQKLIIKSGTYHFYPEKAFEKYVTVSNNDNSLKRIAFPIIDFENLEIDGSGSNFIFHGQMLPFFIENSKNIHLKNVNIDWKRTFHSEGKVIAVDKKNQTFDLQMTDDFPYEIRGNELIYTGDDGYEQGLQENIFYDTTTRALVYDQTKYLMDPWMDRLDHEYKAWEIRKGVVRILDTVAEELPQIGWIFVTKGRKMPNRISPAINIKSATDISISGVNIYHASSMGVVAERSVNITLNKVNITTPPNSKRMLSVAADATHFSMCKGNIIIKDCILENMHDDGTNIHSNYTHFVDFIDDNTIAIKVRFSQFYDLEVMSPGDTLVLTDRTSLMKYAKLKVSKTKKINGAYWHITFDENVRSIIKPNTAFDNVSWNPTNVLITGCTIRNNRARGLLISCSGKVEISNNYFSNEMAAIHISGDANYWCESGPVEEVSITQNTFENCCITKLEQSVIYIDPNILTLSNSDGYYHRNIKIENNQFKTFDKSIVNAESVENLSFINNSVIQTKTFKPLYPEYSTIKLTHIQNTNISNNTYLGDNFADVESDSISAKKLVFNQNKGFIKK
ncbi:MAG: right-handed parallel beta-helix repeat-containing protein [Cytophagales bacterium]|nr:right-handed parallel beta-helix repeat-containing protein [Cytophagales bacterium]